MKSCPICAAKAFDDAEVCFGCLHRFEAGDAKSQSAGAPTPPGAPDVLDVGTKQRSPSLVAPSAGSDELLHSRSAPRPPVPEPPPIPLASQPIGAPRTAPGLAAVRSEEDCVPADGAPEAWDAGGDVRVVGESTHAEPGSSGWTVTFELPRIGVEQDPPRAAATGKAVPEADEDSPAEGRHGLSRSACRVVVQVAASSFTGAGRYGRGASAMGRAAVRSGDGRGSHAREQWPADAAVLKPVGGA